MHVVVQFFRACFWLVVFSSSGLKISVRLSGCLDGWRIAGSVGHLSSQNTRVTDRGCTNPFQRAALEETCPKLVRTGNLGVPPEDLRIASGRAPTPGGLRGPDRCRAGVARGTHPPKSLPQEIRQRRQRRGLRGPFCVGQDVSAFEHQHVEWMAKWQTNHTSRPGQ